MQASDCASRRCVAGKCTAASCTDLVTDGDETDIDCGGSCPRRCAVDGGCAAGADCFEQICAGGRCQPPTCTDGKKNGSESDLDCGRMCATRCMSGQLCLVPNDCAVGQCVAGVCPVLTPSCMDGFLNQDEVDVDCGGTRCTKCGNGRTCRNAGDCLSGFCSKGLTCVAGYSQVRMFGGQMLGLASGDLNADGVTDLISVDNTTLYTWLGQVDAGFLAPTPVSINVVGYSNAVARLADFSGDGRLDALTVATNTGSSEVLLFRGSASGFLAPTVLSAHPPGTNHRSVAVADLDADGRLDVVTAWGGAGVPPGGFVVLEGGPLGLSVATTLTLTGRTPAATTCYGVAVGRPLLRPRLLRRRHRHRRLRRRRPPRPLPHRADQPDRAAERHHLPLPAVTRPGSLARTVAGSPGAPSVTDPASTCPRCPRPLVVCPVRNNSPR